MSYDKSEVSGMAKIGGWILSPEPFSVIWKRLAEWEYVGFENI